MLAHILERHGGQDRWLNPRLDLVLNGDVGHALNALERGLGRIIDPELGFSRQKGTMPII